MADGPLNYILPIVVPLLFVGGLFWLAWRDTRQQHSVWSAFAARRDWDFTATGKLATVMEIQGLHQGHQVSLLTEHRGSGKSRYDVTVLRVDLGDSVPRRLALSPEDRLFNFTNDKQGEARDAALGLAIQKGLVTTEVRQVLQEPRVRGHLLELGQHYPRYSIEERLLEAEHRGVPETVEALEAVIAPALALVEALDEAATGARRSST
ncbi:hypothetical protein ACLESD_49935 [Pyxidicoccus sp. 3LFB2]